jgi:potassium-dependent mechanosensitive channel
MSVAHMSETVLRHLGIATEKSGATDNPGDLLQSGATIGLQAGRVLLVTTLTNILGVLLLTICLSLPSLAFGDSDIANIESSIKTLRTSLANVTGAVDPATVSDEVFTQQRNALDGLKSDAVAIARSLDQPQADVAAQISQLGPAAAPDVAEPAEIAAQRKALADRASQLLGLRKQLELIVVEADQHHSRLSSIERDQFLNRVFASENSVLDPRLWWGAITASRIFVSRTSNLVIAWWSNVSAQANFSVLLAMVLALLLLFFGVNRLRRIFYGMLSPSLHAENGSDAQPSPVRKLWHAIFRYLQWVLLSLLSVMIVLIGLDAAALMTSQLEFLVGSIARAVVPVLLYTGAAYMVCQPTQPEARLVAIENSAARNLVILTALASTVYAVGSELTNVATALSVPFDFAVGVSALSAVGLVVFVGLGLLLIRREANKGIAVATTPYFLVWTLTFVPFIWLLLVFALGALAFGFIALGLFTVGNVLETAMLAVVLGVLHAFAHAIADAAGDARSRTGVMLRRFTSASEDGMARLILIFRTMSDLGTVIAAVFGLAALWAVSLLDFTSLVRKAADGFTIGNISVSPTSLFGALVILLLGIAITRYVTGWLQTRVLSATRLDKGVQDSVRTGAGYAGYILAALFALSAAGVSFSNLALVAGALGVGIGFGLQSIVNNFVSGLILLAERPVRVGDWIVTPSGEGIVKRINVRATEIEAFDGSSIIIPNLNLITTAVRNWTLRDTMGNFAVKVAVAYDGKADEIADTLKAMAVAHPKVMRHPSPTVKIVNLTPQAMEYELGGQVMNVLEADGVASDLRFEIVKTLGKKLLHIPVGAAKPVR